jgi:PST family polysaccharide transporter
MMLLGILLPSKTFPFAIIGPTILGVAFDSVVFLSYTALRCLDQHSKITLLQFASSLALIGIAWAVPIGNGNIESFAIGRAILSAISLAVTITIIGKHYFGHPIPSKPALDVLQSAHPFMVAELASSVYVKADLMIVSLVLGSVGASIYGPALNLLQATFLIPRALYLLTVPMLSRGHTRDHQSFLRRSLTLLATQSVVGAGLSLGVYLVTPIAIRSVFGSAYQSSAEILYRLSPIPFLRSLNFALAAMLASGNRQPQRTRIQMLCAVFSVSANLTVVYVFGLKSVPIVYVFSELILCLGYLLIARDWLSQEITKVGIY